MHECIHEIWSSFSRWKCMLDEWQLILFVWRIHISMHDWFPFLWRMHIWMIEILSKYIYWCMIEFLLRMHIWMHEILRKCTYWHMKLWVNPYMNAWKLWINFFFWMYARNFEDAFLNAWNFEFFFLMYACVNTWNFRFGFLNAWNFWENA